MKINIDKLRLSLIEFKGVMEIQRGHFMTGPELAHELGIKYYTYARIERDGKLSYKSLVQICEAIQQPVNNYIYDTK